jgi:hypothetical protein
VVGRHRLVTRVLSGVVAGVLAAACSAEADEPVGGGDADGGRPPASQIAPGSEGASCPPPGDGARPWDDGASVDLVTLDEGGGDQPRVLAAAYPRPDHDGDPWSQWGQGVVLPDGRFLSAIGDHLGRDGNSYLYELDPGEQRLTLVGDVASLAGHDEGDWGYGKVHAQMVAGPCGEVYVASYWGTRQDIEYGGSYRGDVLLRLDAEARTSENLGVVLEEHGVPSLAGWAEGGLLYAEAADPERFDPQQGELVVLDMATGEKVFATDGDDDHRGFRAMAVDVEGRALFSRTDGRLARYDPASGDITELDDVLPGEFLRAATAPAPDGTVYLATQEPDVLYALGPDDVMREVAELEGYTASLALSPDGDRVWYVPDAHGGAAQRDTPVIEVDTATGDQRVVVELDPLARDVLGLSLGGTYNVAVDTTGSVLYLGMNAAEPDADDTFGEVVQVMVELP